MNVSSPSILVVEDEPKLASLLADYLRAEHYHVDLLDEGTGVVARVRENPPDLLLLDIMLPGKDGITVCREIRAFSDLPVIMITARVEEIDRLLGLEMGADDYICKPFSPREAVARVKALLRRTYHTAVPPKNPPVPGSAATEGNAATRTTPAIQVDEETYQAQYKGQPLDLTPAEFRLLRLFTVSPGKVFNRDRLLSALHADNRVVTDRTIDTHIKNLRRKLQQVHPQKDCITSIYGVGYRFEQP